MRARNGDPSIATLYPNGRADRDCIIALRSGLGTFDALGLLSTSGIHNSQDGPGDLQRQAPVVFLEPSVVLQPMSHFGLV